MNLCPIGMRRLNTLANFIAIIPSKLYTNTNNGVYRTSIGGYKNRRIARVYKRVILLTL